MTLTENELTNHSYIDHELSANLDSTEAFEGPEKLLEIWFYPSANKIPNGSKTLRELPVETWVSLLKLVNCEVLSIKSTEKMDAFLLSESSMFVFDHKLTLKTCGTTTTLLCLPELFKIINEDLQWQIPKENEHYKPYKVFYSRRSFMFPMRQRSIHRNWSHEVEYLNQFFCNGRSYIVGRNDDRDHWNLYVTETNETMHINQRQNEEEEDDETLEILMTGLNPDRAHQFTSNRQAEDGHLLGFEMTDSTGLRKLYGNKIGASFHHDAFAFTPCGYSANLILDEEYYYTLHVTPEKGWSYASFESNVPVARVSRGEQNNIDVLNSVLDVFAPDDFCVTFFCKSLENRTIGDLMHLVKNVPHYAKMDRIVYDLDDYHLIYLRFKRTS